MKKFLLILVAFFPFALAAQDYEEVSNAFSAGDANTLARMMDTSIDYSVDGEDQTIGRGDAENKLRSFFLSNRPTTFSIVHKGVSKNDVHYLIGDLITSSGGYRVTAYMNKSGQDYLIQSLEFERQ